MACPWRAVNEQLQQSRQEVLEQVAVAERERVAERGRAPWGSAQPFVSGCTFIHGSVPAVNKQAQQWGQELLEQVAAAERERAAEQGEAPLGEWEALRVRTNLDAPLTSQALLTSSEEAQDLLQESAWPLVNNLA